jgi:uncharacterized membrane protein YccC
MSFWEIIAAVVLALFLAATIWVAIEDVRHRRKLERMQREADEKPRRKLDRMQREARDGEKRPRAGFLP